MSLLSIEDLRTLVEQPQGLCVSIYMPTIRAGAEVQQNPIRFKNVIKAAEAQLQALELNRDDASNLLQPALELDQDEFWQHQDEGLAIFVAQDFFRYYRVPMQFDELVTVSDRFHLKPMMPLLTGDGEFYILALSQKQVRFFEATRHSIKEVEVEGMPKSLDEALQYDETAKEGQFRIGTSAGRNASSVRRAGSATGPHQAGTFHGQGSPDRDEHQKDILQFFYLVDGALHDVLGDKRGPLVLAAVEYLLPIYKEANTYQHLLEDGIQTENVQIVKPDELHEKALSIVEPFFMQGEQAAVERYYEASGAGKTSTNPNEAIPAAYYGRIEQLFVAVGQQQWGNFDVQANELHIHSDAEPGDEDLLNAAAIQTLLNGGTVYAVEPEKVPDAAPLAAVFRF